MSTKKTSDVTVYEMLVAGLEDSIAFSREEKLSLVTTQLPSPPPALKAEDVIRIRQRLNMSQCLFAATLNVSTKTVQGWEQGLRTPSNASLRLLQIARNQPKAVLSVVAGTVSDKTHGARRRTDRVGANRGR